MPDLVPYHMGLFRRTSRTCHNRDPQQWASLVKFLCSHVRWDVHHGAELRVVTPEEVEALLGLVLGDIVIDCYVCSAVGGVRLATPRAAGRG